MKIVQFKRRSDIDNLFCSEVIKELAKLDTDEIIRFVSAVSMARAYIERGKRYEYYSDGLNLVGLVCALCEDEVKEKETAAEH